MDVNKQVLGFFVICLCSLLNFAFSDSKVSQKLNVDVYYESRCPDSKNFMQQLKKVYPKVKDRVNLHYVPFGKAYSYDFHGETKFTCQHGLRECEDNLFQSCVLHLIGEDDQDTQTEFVICAMDFSKNLKTCAKQSGVNTTDLKECVTGVKGVKLQLEAERESEEIIRKSSFVPTIVYNKIYNTADFWDSLDGFENVVTRKFHLQ